MSVSESAVECVSECVSEGAGSQQLVEAVAVPPVIFICGPTGSGKTSVSIKLAKELNGEVINADVYQAYKGLDIATAKITKEEMQGVPHHLLSVYDPKDPINVTDYIQTATQVIHSVQEKGLIPIVVGGSNFYVESLLFNNPALQSPLEKHSSSTTIELSKLSAPELYARLEALNPSAASILHPKDTRRVLRALEKSSNHNSFLQSDSSTDTSITSTLHPLRFPNSIVVHVRCRDQHEQVSRLNARVESMVQEGLVPETCLLFGYLRTSIASWEEYVASEVGGGVDKSWSDSSDGSLHCVNSCRGGVAEAIGFKEFIPYLNFVSKYPAATETSEAKDLLGNAVTDVQHSTVQYAKRQSTWLRNRLVPLCNDSGVMVIDFFTEDRAFDPLLDSVSQSLRCIQSNSDADVCPSETTNVNQIRVGDQVDRITLKRKIFQCETCDNSCFQGKDQYDIHLKSKKHQKRLASKRKREKRSQEAAEISTTCNDDRKCSL